MRHSQSADALSRREFLRAPEVAALADPLLPRSRGPLEQEVDENEGLAAGRPVNGFEAALEALAQACQCRSSARPLEWLGLE